MSKTLEQRLSDLEQQHAALRGEHDALTARIERAGLIPDSGTAREPNPESIATSIKAVHSRGGELWSELVRREFRHGR